MSDFRDTITNVAKSVTKTSGDLLKTTKLNMNLSTAEAGLKNLHLEIGKKVHEMYRGGERLGEFFDGKYIEILAAEEKIAEIKEKIDTIKGVRKCPKCEKIAERESEFCPKCGYRFEPEADDAQEDLSEPPKAPAAEIPTQPVPSEWATTYAANSREFFAPPTMPPAPPTKPPAPAFAAKICRVCNSENDAATKFCLSCGRILD